MFRRPQAIAPCSNAIRAADVPRIQQSCSAKQTSVPPDSLVRRNGRLSRGARRGMTDWPAVPTEKSIVPRTDENWGGAWSPSSIPDGWDSAIGWIGRDGTGQISAAVQSAPEVCGHGGQEAPSGGSKGFEKHSEDAHPQPSLARKRGEIPSTGWRVDKRHHSSHSKADGVFGRDRHKASMPFYVRALTSR